jgi:S-DNA-T family DNA segregation ATPase FtsK/SpoIIIE
MLGIKSVRKNIISVKRIISLLIVMLLLSVSIQSCFIQQVTSTCLVKSIPVGGAIGLFIAKKIFALLNHNQLNKVFIPCMFVFFMLGLLMLKYTINVTLTDIYGYMQKGMNIIHKLINRLKSSANKGEFSLNRQTKKMVDKDAGSDNVVQHESLQQNSQNELSLEGHMTKKTEGYQLPSISCLINTKEDSEVVRLSKEKIKEQTEKLLSVLFEFGVNGEIIDVLPGPVVTMFEFRPAPGIKTSRIISLSDDIARSMSALSARIANIPGKNAIGIELPNEKRQIVYLRSLLSHHIYKQSNSGLPLTLGKDISGNPVIADLAKMPHLLVAGTTGSGKSVSINTMILSLLYKFSPEKCRFIMIDPKMLELFIYNDIPHLLTSVVTEPKKAIYALKWAVREMESRYKAMSRLGVRNVEGFNQKILEGLQTGDLLRHRVQTGFDQETGKPLFETQPIDYKMLPYIVIVVDEMADLMLVAGKDIEMAVQRLAQMARAAGIHLIMATQRPSVDVITGTIKANFPTRISFQVTSKIDSRTILGEQGAEHLLGHGDMLYMSGGGRIQRVHGPFVSDNEVEAVTNFLKSQGEPDYIDGITDEVGDDYNGSFATEVKHDDLFNSAVELIRKTERVSISFIQRNLQIGYNKAAKLVEQMEKEGIVSAPDRTGKRELLV